MHRVGYRLGIDSGGTFTDVVDDRGGVRKVSSTPDDPSRAVAECVGDGVGDEQPQLLVHGTTVATNALLERRGASVALYTTAGFSDVIEIGRQTRPMLFDHFVDRPKPLVPRSMRMEVDERLAPDGTVVRALDPATVPPVPDGVDAVAVCLLHSVVDDAHERALAALLGSEVDVSISSEVAPEFREYERTVTTVLNAYLRPVTRGYLDRLRVLADTVLVMTSSGGVVPLDVAAAHPVSLLLSGPAGGVVAAAAAAEANGFDDVITFDMGGTSTDVCLIRAGRAAPAAEREVAGLPVRTPALDIHTIGAGGGSIAWIDAGGALRVGPTSAGAVPGPACYGRGGTVPTVTDANLVAGRIPEGARLGDLGQLDVVAARAALAGLGVVAQDVIRVVDAEMVRALRVVSVERGVDPRGLALVAFGGAGPLHAASLAEELGMGAVIVPGRAGVLSAVGLLRAPIGREHVMAWPHGTDTSGLAAAADSLAAAARADVVTMSADEQQVTVTVELDARYLGQSHEIRVAALDDFHDAHHERNGYARTGDPIEVVAIRARASAPAQRGSTQGPPAVDAASPIEGPVRGPAMLATDDCSVWVPDGWIARPGAAGAIVMERAAMEHEP